MGHPLFFYTLATLMIASALGVIFTRNPVYAVLSLASTLFALSGLFLLLEAYFVALVPVAISAGAILVLFLFAVMLLDVAPENLLRIKTGTFRFLGLFVGLFFFWQLTAAIRSFLRSTGGLTGLPVSGTTAAVGKLLFTTYALPFEVASLLLLVGIIGAVVLAKKKL